MMDMQMLQHLQQTIAIAIDTPLQRLPTKRELFAAMAMQGILSSPDASHQTANIVAGAVELADALIVELAK